MIYGNDGIKCYNNKIKKRNGKNNCLKIVRKILMDESCLGSK
jgi:hypothetical protein